MCNCFVSHCSIFYISVDLLCPLSVKYGVGLCAHPVFVLNSVGLCAHSDFVSDGVGLCAHPDFVSDSEGLCAHPDLVHIYASQCWPLCPLKLNQRILSLILSQLNLLVFIDLF